MIIDAHCHAGTGELLTGPWDTSAPLNRYIGRARRAGITCSVLFPIFSTNYRQANRRIARIVRSAPDRFLGFAMVHAERDAGQIESIVHEAALHYGFRGIKVHRYDARITREVCEVARSLSLPVLYDVMGEAAIVELLASEFPDVDFIIPHLGSFSDDWRAHLTVSDQLVRHANVFTDTSGVRRFDFLVEAVRRAGPEKIIFGSDGPWLHPGLELAKVKALGLSPQDEALVLRHNLVRLIGRARLAPSPLTISVSPKRPQHVSTGNGREVRDPWDRNPFPNS